MSQQIALSDLMSDLSTDEQQLLAGGQFLSDSREDGDGSSDDDEGTTRLYRISSTALVRVRKIR
ncbi:hypothetical protein CLI64_05740 [Nostoc sp. CENA543]|uniref:hypothetical protein n=1 Tax=Nostoc sp. CENA543 TaxID=1869241 RepID=UPI000CA1B16A|nr:hypothetical protein [Nostoc sp. CENA543]AUS99930.1 hypothetical protein CLI64_05740 [Nostoc sp. CENA543]